MQMVIGGRDQSYRQTVQKLLYDSFLDGNSSLEHRLPSRRFVQNMLIDIGRPFIFSLKI